MKKLWGFSVAVLVAANLAFLGGPVSGAPPMDDKACACVDGSGPEPRPPYTPECISWYFSECTSAETCTCGPN